MSRVTVVAKQDLKQENLKVVDKQNQSDIMVEINTLVCHQHFSAAWFPGCPHDEGIERLYGAPVWGE